MKNIYTKGILIAAVALMPVLALAQTNATVQTTSAVTAPGAKVGVRATITASSTAETTRAARAKERAAQEIDRRIASLNAMLVRVTAMKKITAELKANLKQNVELEIQGFTALKEKIEADTDLATLKTDIQSVTQSYRIYALVMPQVHISVAADRMATIINMMVASGAKLQARINTAKSAGNDTTALETALQTLGTKLQSAQAHAQASVNLIAPLVPDQGDKTVQASNEAAIKNAQAEIKAGHADLVAARKEIGNIIKGLGTMKASATASTTVGQ